MAKDTDNKTAQAPVPFQFGDFHLLPVANLRPPSHNPRAKVSLEGDKLPGFKATEGKTGTGNLAADIKRNGLIHPLVVYPMPKTKDQFEVVCGARRLEAIKSLGWSEVPCHVVTDQADLDMIQLRENVGRSGLSVYEQAKAVERIRKAKKWTAKQAAAETGYSESYVNKFCMALTPGRLAPEIEKAWENGEALLTVNNITGKILKAGDHAAQLAAFEALQKGTVGDSDGSTGTGTSTGKGNGSTDPDVKTRSKKVILDVATMAEAMTEPEIDEHERDVIVATLRWALCMSDHIAPAKGRAFLADPIAEFKRQKKAADKAAKAAEKAAMKEADKTRPEPAETPIPEAVAEA